MDEDLIGDSFDVRKKNLPPGSTMPFYQNVVKTKDTKETLQVTPLKLKGKIPTLATAPEDPIMKIPEGGLVVKPKST